MSVPTCKNGHVLTQANIYKTPTGFRCATCQRLHAKKWTERHKGEFKKITVVLSLELFDALEREARAREIHLADIVRERLATPRSEAP